MREKLLKKLADWHASHPWRMLGISILVTLILVSFAGQLGVTMRMQDLMPTGDPRVDEFNQIIDGFATATSLIVVVQGEEADIKAFADDLAPRIPALRDSSRNTELKSEIARLHGMIEKLRTKKNKETQIEELQSEIEYLGKRIDMQLFQRVDYKVDIEYLRDHALMLIKSDDLDNMKELFTDPSLSGLLTNINNSMEKEYIGQEESISTREKEDGAVGFLDGIETLLLKLQKAAKGEEISREEIFGSADKFLLGEPYFISYDKKALILTAIPNFTILDRDDLMIAAETVQKLVDELLQQHPGVRAGLSGDIAREHDEQIHSTQAIGLTTGIAFIAIFILLIISFRMWVAPVLAMVNLIVGLIWSMGTIYLVVGELNMMTAMFSVVLVGLGIDFSIHLISQFTEWRAAGDSILVAMEKTYLKSGKGIITGAFTTACAFLALLVSSSRGMKELGFVAGTGLLAILLTTLFFLPVMLVFRERRIDRKLEKKGIKKTRIQRNITLKSLGNLGDWLSRHYTMTLLLSLVVSVLLVWSAFQIQYDTNFMNMEPKGLTSIALSDTIMHKFDLSMENALCLANSVDESRELAEKYRDLGTVAMTSDISVYLPSEAEQTERIPLVRNIRSVMRSAPISSTVSQRDVALLSREIGRLEMNIMEMQDMAFIGGQDKVDTKCKVIVGDPDDPDSKNIIREIQEIIDGNRIRSAAGLSGFQRVFSPYFKNSVIKMSSTAPTDLNNLPIAVLDQYSNKDRNQFMVTVYPSGGLYVDTAVLNRFVDDVQRVNVKTTGAPVIAVAWLQIAARDGRNAILLTLTIVFLLLWIDFKRPWFALIAMIPLALGAFWMVGLMYLAGMMFTFMTFAGLPLIIGIGIDDGVHIIHRWQHEGTGKIQTVFSSTGKAILLTSLTTMLAFGSMTFSVFPAWAWFGQSLFLGVGACFVTTVLILPGILGWIERLRARKNK